MGVLSSRYWDRLTTEEFAHADMAAVVAVQPVAATEQHGPHLPVSVDAAINRALVERVVDQLPEEVRVLFLPPLAVGVSPEHGDFPGTLSLAHRTMQHVLTDIGVGVRKAGVRKLAFLNSHGGQSHILDIAARMLRRQHRMLVFPLNAYRYWDGAARFGEHEAAHGIHAGAIETSIMLAIDPNAVRRDKVRRFESLTEKLEVEFDHVRPFGREAPFGWQAQDLNVSGAVGDATLASADDGAALLDQAAGKMSVILREIAALSPDIIGDDG